MERRLWCADGGRDASFPFRCSSAGVTEEERTRIVDLVAAEPSIGDLIKGAGGARKVRFARSGKGKSGGYRVITYHAEPAMPVFLLALFSKGERANLSKAECNALATLTKRLLAAYRGKTQS